MTTWHNGGDWNSIPVGDLAIIISQLCIAVNEREHFLVLDVTTGLDPVLETEFSLPDGSKKSRPTVSDLGSLIIEETNTIVSEIRTALTYILENKLFETIRFQQWLKLYYFDTINYFPIVAINDVLAIGTYGPNWIPFDRAENNKIWNQLKEVIDNIIFVYSLRLLNTGINGEIINTPVNTPDAGIRNPKIDSQEIWTGLRNGVFVTGDITDYARIQIGVIYYILGTHGPSAISYINNKGQQDLSIDSVPGKLLKGIAIFQIIGAGKGGTISTTSQPLNLLVNDLTTIIIGQRTLSNINTENDPFNNNIIIDTGNLRENITLTPKLEWSNLTSVLPFDGFENRLIPILEDGFVENSIGITPIVLKSATKGEIENSTRAIVKLRQGTQEDIDNQIADVLF